MLALFSGCALSQQQEVERGARAAQQVGVQLPLVHHAAGTQYVTAPGRRLGGMTDSRGLTWTFSVVDSRAVNAFGIPGGWIYIIRGLNARTVNESELAGVIAHGIGHVTR